MYPEKYKPTRNLLRDNLNNFWNRDVEYYKQARDMNKQMTSDRKSLMDSLVPDQPVLDISSGTAENSMFVGGRNYFAMDISFLALKMAKEYGNVFVTQADAYDLPIKEEAFYNIICTNSVEHFIFVEKAFKEMWRVLKKGGVLALIFPNYGDYFFRLPPSMESKGATLKFKYFAKQLSRKLVLILGIKKFMFPIIYNPDVLSPKVGYKQDNDITYPPSAHEISNYFKLCGAKNIKLNFYRFVFKKPVFKNLKTNLARIIRAIYYWIPLFKYQHCGFIIIRKQ